MLERAAGIVLLIGAIVAAALGLGGDPVACVAADLCDGAAVGTGSIAQPVAAWSALALGGVGVWLAGIRSDRLIGFAMVLSGIGALRYHATLTTWAGTLDGIGVAAVAGAFAVKEWIPDEELAARMAGAIVVVAAVSGAPEIVAIVAGSIAGVRIVMRARNRDHRSLAVAVVLFGAGAMAWLSGPHAVWHVGAAAAVGILTVHLRSSRTPKPNLRSGPT